jgi:hypothetical protein
MSALGFQSLTEVIEYTNGFAGRAPSTCNIDCPKGCFVRSLVPKLLTVAEGGTL